MSEKEARTIKLRCPPLSRTVTIAARDEQRLDLGSIARAFGLDPQTLKLNGHFVSRGADLVSPSVTWRSLLSFFSSKGLPTGADGGGALVVDGKLLRIGRKRGHDPEGTMGRPKQDEHEDENCSGQSRRQSEEVRISKTAKRSKIDDSDRRCCSFSVIDNGLGSKRKHLSEEVSLLKRLKINDASSGECHCQQQEPLWKLLLLYETIRALLGFKMNPVLTFVEFEETERRWSRGNVCIW